MRPTTGELNPAMMSAQAALDSLADLKMLVCRTVRAANRANEPASVQAASELAAAFARHQLSVGRLASMLSLVTTPTEFYRE